MMTSFQKHLVLAVLFLATVAVGRRDGAPTGFQHLDPHTLVFLPRTKYQTALMPVLLFLNGAGENGFDGFRQISNNFGQDIWRRRGQVAFLIVAPQCSDRGSWRPGGPDAKRALAALDTAIERYGGDRQRVYVTGVLEGSGALAVASAYPERFAAVWPVSTGSSGDTQKLDQSNIAIWSYFNRDDRGWLVKSAREASDSRRSGFRRARDGSDWRADGVGSISFVRSFRDEMGTGIRRIAIRRRIASISSTFCSMSIWPAITRCPNGIRSRYC